jgi:translation initiation factor IF-3
MHRTHVRFAEAIPKKERAKTPEAPKITLLDMNDNISVCTMQEAEKIAYSKKLRLVQVIDAKLKTQRPTFKLMSEAEYLEQELKEKLKSKEEKKKDPFLKGEKLATISVRSTKHDIEVKVKKSLKWLEKKYEVRIIILGNADNTAPQVRLSRTSHFTVRRIVISRKLTIVCVFFRKKFTSNLKVLSKT